MECISIVLHTIYIIVNILVLITRNMSSIVDDGCAGTKAQRSLIRNKDGLFHDIGIHNPSYDPKT